MFIAPILSAPQEEGRSSEWIGTQLQAVVAHTKFGSNAFHHAVSKFLSDNNFIELQWQPHLGTRHCGSGSYCLGRRPTVPQSRSGPDLTAPSLKPCPRFTLSRLVGLTQ